MVTKREKRACKSCEERGVLAAPLPPRIIEKSLVSDRVVIDTVVSKYADHCPLYRQSAMLERDSGVELSRQTLDGWVLRVGELLVPLAEALRQELLRGSYLQADETPVGVQMHDGKGRNHLAYLWQYGQPHGAVVFDFRMGRGREGPKHFLGNFEGLLQSDGYAVYDSVGGPKMVHACCWSHARRKFVEAVKLHPQDAEAVRIRKIASADSERMKSEADVLKGNPLLINKIIAERLSDKLQIMMVPSDAKIFFNDVMKGGITPQVMDNDDATQSAQGDEDDQNAEEQDNKPQTSRPIKTHRAMNRR